MNTRTNVALCLFIVSMAALMAQERAPLLLQEPALSQSQIAFSYRGDIWVVRRQGGQAHRVVTGTGLGAAPVFSPDGQWIAYTGIRTLPLCPISSANVSGK